MTSLMLQFEYMKIADHPFYMGLSPNGAVKLKNTAKSIATFICDTDDDVQILTPDGDKILNTFGLFISRCADKEFLEELRVVLTPMQKKMEGECGFPTM